MLLQIQFCSIRLSFFAQLQVSKNVLSVQSKMICGPWKQKVVVICITQSVTSWQFRCISRANVSTSWLFLGICHCHVPQTGRHCGSSFHCTTIECSLNISQNKRQLSQDQVVRCKSTVQLVWWSMSDLSISFFGCTVNSLVVFVHASQCRACQPYWQPLSQRLVILQRIGLHVFYLSQQFGYAHV